MGEFRHRRTDETEPQSAAVSQLLFLAQSTPHLTSLYEKTKTGNRLSLALLINRG
ncbi:MAG: hypothetical protein NT047_08190 [Deltaproteobacteria bacterium]|nr:hypothetical protein [Deltaproteobacteria bacterium]